jgi:predicted metal-dependent phosphotriesterase family hydrolase
MADQFVRDIEVGIQGTDIKAGFLKCCTDHQGVTDDVEKVLRATARASNRTGRPIMIDRFPQELVDQSAANWHMIYVLDEIVPALKEAGVTGEQVDAMMVGAPRRWLAQ